MTLEHKQSILAHCLWMAQTDPDYALWAARWYERNEPALLKNLAAKVEQEIRRAERAEARPDGPPQP
jgi:hypothetical protein